MKQLKENDFAERRKTALSAKQQLIERAKAVAKTVDPDLPAKRAERAELAAARELKRIEREKLAREAAELKKIEDAANAEAAAEAARLEALAKTEREAAEAAERKAERDRRYAARKNRKR